MGNGSVGRGGLAPAGALIPFGSRRGPVTRSRSLIRSESLPYPPQRAKGTKVTHLGRRNCRKILLILIHVLILVLVELVLTPPLGVSAGLRDHSQTALHQRLYGSYRS
jgi:hypothetical protein